MKLTWRTKSCPTNVSPMIVPSPVIKFTTPFGNIEAKRIMVKAGARVACSDSLITTVLPASKACGNFEPKIAKGQFHGTIKVVTPRDWRVMIVSNCGPLIVAFAPSLSAKPATWRNLSANLVISILVSNNVLPCSCVKRRLRIVTSASSSFKQSAILLR